MPSGIPRKKPTHFQIGTYWVMRIAGVFGLASIVDAAKVWVGFIREVVQLYQDWIRVPLYNAILMVWPAAWPVPSRIWVDVAIIWTSFFAAANYHIIREEGRNVVSHIYTNENNMMASRPMVLLRTTIKVATIFLLGPVLYPMLAIANYRRGGGKDDIVMTDWIVMKPREILKYVFQQVAVILFLLFISYQMKQQGIF